MRHILIVLFMCVAAIAIGTALYVFGPEELNEAAALDASGAAAVTSGPLEDISFAVLAEGQNAARVTERKNYAVYDEAEYARLWQMAYGDDAPPMPEVDFAREYVIGVFAGVKPSGGYDITVTQVADSSTERTVAITLVSPGEGCMTTQAFTSPFELVRVPNADLEIVKEETQTATACR
ncbi:MAG TPA: protease complex subunit PrcB family protein [Candidatus Paceibacterota bacterium]|nr:protease complex subunit PrcB family protein [Candidatus Paceibacterota bacterium]